MPSLPFATPLALLGLAFLPLVLAFYLLKLRRDEHVVPSTLLWQRLVADVEANAPWQRLRRSLLLLLQLLLVVLLALLAARPFLERPAGLARDLVLVVDASASMGATDVEPNRLEAAKRAALGALRELPSGGRVSVIVAGRTARVVANGTDDLGRVRQAIASIGLTDDAGDLGDALRLASALAARSGDAEVVVATDAAFADPPSVSVSAPVRVLQVGRARRNQAIVALAVRTMSTGVERSVFASVANTDVEEARRRIELWGDGRLLEARELFLDPMARADVSIDDVPADVRVIEVRLGAIGPDGGAAPDGTEADDLAIDDRAFAVVPPDRLRRILLVTDGDPYLETALTYLPNTELYGVAPDAYGSSTHPELFDLIIFQGALPVDLPRAPILAIAPSRSSPLGEVTGTLDEPGIGTPNPDEPLLRYVDLSTVHIAQARRLELPGWARTVIPGPGGAPLLYSGERVGQRVAVLAFEPRASDLPLQVAFPVLLSNLVGELLGASAAPAEAVAPGTPVTLAIPVGATGLGVTRPDGTTVDLALPTVGATSVQFSGADRVGVYTVEAHGLPNATSAPSAEAPSPSGVSSPASPSASGSLPPDASPASPPTAPPVDPTAPVRFAVDLFDVGESTIAPGSAAALERLGASRTPASPAPGASGAPGEAGAAGRPPARDELWGPLLLLVLAFLVVEWAVYEREALVRFRRSLAARFGRTWTA